MNNIAKDLWEIFGAKYASRSEFNFTEADIKELESELQWKRNMRELEAQQAAKDEAERHDW